MYIYMHIYLYINIHVCIYIFTYLIIYTYLYTYICVGRFLPRPENIRALFLIPSKNGGFNPIFSTPTEMLDHVAPKLNRYVYMSTELCVLEYGHVAYKEVWKATTSNF
jgi:hypothetical protein